jgi:hypothetical protein
MTSERAEGCVGVNFEGTYGYGPIRLHRGDPLPPGSHSALDRIEIPEELLARYDAAKAEWDAVQTELMVLVGRLESTKAYREASVRLQTECFVTLADFEPEIMNDIRVRDFVTRVATLPLRERDACILKLTAFAVKVAKEGPARVSELMAKLLEISPVQEENAGG